MFNLEGKHGKAIVYSDSRNEKSELQIKEMLDQEWSKNANVRIMPDYHAGAGCVIGTTMTIGDKVVPNLTGVDIGCGMLVVNLGKIDIDLNELDKFIENNIPNGFNIHDDLSEDVFIRVLLDNLVCKNQVNIDRALKSVGTLGGGNHFLELDKDEDDQIFLIIHSGSRNLGKNIADYYQNMAFKECNNKDELIRETVDLLKSMGRQQEIQKSIEKINETKPKIPKALSYLEGESLNNYLHDMDMAQLYASINRYKMAEKIVEYLGMDINNRPTFETIHNYIDTDNMILRKGAVSAQKDENLIIPMNMRDGCLICRGKGNVDWNYSAPHGAGRIMSRTQARNNVSLSEFENSMKGICSNSVVESTIDESPMAYKPMQEIIDNIGDTVEILEIIKPIYNFKAK